MILTVLYKEFFKSEKTGGLLLFLATLISLLLANSALSQQYLSIWQLKAAGMSIEHWINDGLMAVFFLLIGLELEREIYVGELSKPKKALLPVIAAIGGVLLPVLLFMAFNYGLPTQDGAGIPMATDIAFALGVLSLLGNKVPGSLKIFLTALAVIDDLIAILVIAIFYSKGLDINNLIICLGIFATLIILNRLKVRNLIPYIVGGAAMWFFMLHSGVHATISGVMLAFVIPFGNGEKQSPSHKLQHFLHKPVAYIILPLFALANTAILLGSNLLSGFNGSLEPGIIIGLLIGKPSGVLMFAFLAVLAGVTALPSDLKWKHLLGAGFLAGIGFTMSMFITYLAFEDVNLINTSKIAILAASLLAGLIGFLILKQSLRSEINDTED